MRIIDFDECQNADFHTCHEYAHCENDVGTYICKCFDGFFGDGEECQGRTNLLIFMVKSMSVNH